MTDIQSNNNDFLICQSENTGEDLYDFALVENYDQALEICLTTPKGSLTESTLNVNSGFQYIDADLGNNLYNRLSDPLTANWIQEINSDIRSALSQLDIPIVITEINSTPSLDGIHLRINYSLDQNQYSSALFIAA